MGGGGGGGGRKMATMGLKVLSDMHDLTVRLTGEENDLHVLDHSIYTHTVIHGT